MVIRLFSEFFSLGDFFFLLSFYFLDNRLFFKILTWAVGCWRGTWIFAFLIGKNYWRFFRFLFFSQHGAQWRWITAIMESFSNPMRISSFFINFVNDFDALDFFNTSEIVSSKRRNHFNIFISIASNSDFFRQAIQFRGISLEDNKLDYILSKKWPFLSFKNWNEFNGNLFQFDQINSWLNFLEHLFNHEFELIHFFPSKPNTTNRSVWVINSHEDGPALRVHETDNGFEESFFEEGFLDGEGVVFELYSHGLER